MHLFFRLGDQLVRAAVPGPIIDALRLGRMTALQKPNGGIRGIVAGDDWSHAQWPSKWVVQWRRQPLPTSTHYRPVPDCHGLQTLCEANPETTLVSINGVSAFDSISREAMLRGLLGVAEERRLSRSFASSMEDPHSQYLWEDDSGNVHTIQQGEGGEQGDALMPLLYSLGQHQGLDEVVRGLLPTEKLFAYLDDVYVVTTPDRVYTFLQENLWVFVGVRINSGKTQVWNAAGRKPLVCEAMDRIAQAQNPEAKVWRGSEVPVDRQGVKVLGAPIGHPAFVACSPVGSGSRAPSHSSAPHPIDARLAVSQVVAPPLCWSAGHVFSQSGQPRGSSRLCHFT